jgi:beta-glucosidase
MDLASFDTQSASWIAEKGTYTLNIGASSMDIKQKESFKLSDDLVVEKVNKALTPHVAINELGK